jgi:transcriptional/translational regulatory protein YebC/TACO1
MDRYDRRDFLRMFTAGLALSAMHPKSILADPNAAVTEVAKQATTTPASVSLNQVLRVLENAKAGLPDFGPNMTIGELLGKAQASQIPKKTKSQSQSSPVKYEALRIEAIGQILAAITSPAQHLSGQIKSIANKAV